MACTSSGVSCLRGRAPRPGRTWSPSSAVYLATVRARRLVRVCASQRSRYWSTVSLAGSRAMPWPRLLIAARLPRAAGGEQVQQGLFGDADAAADADRAQLAAGDRLVELVAA